MTGEQAYIVACEIAREPQPIPWEYLDWWKKAKYEEIADDANRKIIRDIEERKVPYA